MVLVSVHDLDDDVYPGVQEYAKCQSKAFMKGFIGFVAGAAAGVTGSIFARQKFPSRFAPTHTVSMIAGGGIVFGYIAASLAAKDCQRKWVSTARAAGYNTDGISSPSQIPHQSPSQTTSPSPSQTPPPSHSAHSNLDKDLSSLSTAVASTAKGYDEPDRPGSFKKTKYGDTMG